MKASLWFTRLLVSCTGLLANRCLAQDVTVTDPVWQLAEAPPAVLPKGRLRPGFPDEMRKTSEPGYVMIHRYLDADGKNRSIGATGTNIAFQRAVESEFHDWDMSPAKRDGKPIAGAIWVSVIFNPKSASAKAPDASPRLLAVNPVISAKPPVSKTASPVVRVHVKLDANGAVLEAEPETEISEQAAAAIRESVPKFRFASARKGGQPIAAEFSLAVLCEPPARSEKANQIPPRAVKRVPPEYPVAMKASRMRGEVTLAFEVDVDGSVKNPVIVSSNNPGFDNAAIEALLKWKFEPATHDGKPVKAKMRLPMMFNIEGGIMFSNGDRIDFQTNDAYSISRPSNSSKLPPEQRFDSLAKIRGIVIPVYPYALFGAKVRGSAKVAMAIDAQGRVIKVQIIEASKPEFGLATAAAIETFTFDPAMRDAKAVPSAMKFEQEFSTRTPADQATFDLFALEKNHPERIIGAGKLDSPLNPISRKPPIFPLSLLGKVADGKAVLEVLIDVDGHVRLPRVISATDDAFGYSASQAVSLWIFDPPKAGGKKVVSRVQVPFNFKGPEVIPSASAPTEPADPVALPAPTPEK